MLLIQPLDKKTDFTSESESYSRSIFAEIL